MELSLKVKDMALVPATVLFVAIVEYTFVFLDAVLGILLSLINAIILYGLISVLSFHPRITDAAETTGLLFIYIMLVSSLPWFFFRQDILVPAVYSVVLGLCFGYVYLKNLSLRDLGFVRARFLRWMLLGTAVGTPMGLIEYLIIVPTSPIPAFQLTYFLQTLVYMVLFVSLGEELLFRGLIQRKLEGAYGSLKGLLLAATLFAIMHLGWRNVYEIIFVFIAGLLLGYLYQRTRSLVGPIFLHGANNLVMLAVFPFLLP